LTATQLALLQKIPGRLSMISDKLGRTRSVAEGPQQQPVTNGWPVADQDWGQWVDPEWAWPIDLAERHPLGRPLDCGPRIHYTPTEHWWSGEEGKGGCHQAYVQGCREPGCIDCWDVRRKRTASKIRLVLATNAVNKWVHFWTFSVKNNGVLAIALDDLVEVANRFRHRAIQQRSRGRGRHPWLLIDGWVAVNEITHDFEDGSGFNAHLHMLAWSDRERINWKSVHRHWNQAAGYPAQFNATPGVLYGGPQTERIVGYMAKYLAKGHPDDPIVWGGLDQAVAETHADDLRGRRFLRGFYHLPPAAPAICQCGHGDWVACCELKNGTCAKVDRDNI